MLVAEDSCSRTDSSANTAFSATALGSFSLSRPPLDGSAAAAELEVAAVSTGAGTVAGATRGAVVLRAATEASVMLASSVPPTEGTAAAAVEVSAEALTFWSLIIPQSWSVACRSRHDNTIGGGRVQRKTQTNRWCRNVRQNSNGFET